MSFVGAGADVLTIHQEASPHLHRQLTRIRELGARAGVAINPRLQWNNCATSSTRSTSCSS